MPGNHTADCVFLLKMKEKKALYGNRLDDMHIIMTRQVENNPLRPEGDSSKSITRCTAGGQGIKPNTQYHQADNAMVLKRQKVLTLFPIGI